MTFETISGRLALSLTLLVVASCGGGNPPPQEGEIATWDGDPVLEEQLVEILRATPAGGRPSGGIEAVAKWLGGQAEDLVLNRFLEQKGRSAGWADSPDLVSRARLSVLQELAGLATRQQCGSLIVEEAQVEARYSEETRRGAREWILVRHIFKRAPTAGGARREARTATEQIAARLLAGESFVEVARNESDGETATEGGLIGRLSRRAPIEPAVLRAAWQLEDGEFSGVVEVTNGFHIVRREESGVEQVATFEARRPAIEAELQREVRRRCARELQEGATEVPAGSAITALRADIRLPESRELTPEEEEAAHRAVDQTAALAALADLEQNPGFDTLGATVDREVRRLVVSKAWQEELSTLVSTWTDERLRATYDRDPRRFDSEPTASLQLVWVEGEGQGRRAPHERAVGVAERWRDGEAFEKLAADVGRSAETGELPWSQLEARVGSPLIAAAHALPDGGVTEPLEVAGGPRPVYAVARILGRTASEPRTFEAAIDDVRRHAAGEKVQETQLELRRNLLEQAGFELSEAAVELLAHKITGGSAAP